MKDGFQLSAKAGAVLLTVCDALSSITLNNFRGHGCVTCRLYECPVISVVYPSPDNGISQHFSSSVGDNCIHAMDTMRCEANL